MSFVSFSSSNHSLRLSKPLLHSLPFLIPPHLNRLTHSKNKSSLTTPVPPPLHDPKEGRIRLRKFVKCQLRTSTQTYGLGGNMARNPSKGHHIQGLPFQIFVIYLFIIKILERG
ncbi:hypothetical protein E2542_SST13868 [Spatholobus suberectus]|nr:hypothetical protein E2542_SST13868 [Spatholobus suberectus]